MNSCAIELENVTKYFRIYHEKHDTIFERIFHSINKKQNYEKLVALDNLSLTINTGEMFGIVGKNGAGKSTMLKIISGIFKPDKGKISTNGSIVPLIQLGAGFHPELTARDNIILYGMILGISKKDITNKVDEILQFAELEKFSDTKIKNFSSGMYSRLAFSTAVQIDPDIILVDEVLSVGDITFRKKSFDTFMSFHKRGKTIVYVSQDLDSIKNLCDRALLLNNGKIQIIGDPAKVVEEYKKLS